DRVLDGCDTAEIGDLTREVLTVSTPQTTEYVRKRPGKVKYGDITLKMEAESGGAKVLLDWFENSPGERKSGSIIYLDREGNEVLRCPDCDIPQDAIRATYSFFDCFPVGYSIEEEVSGDGSVRTFLVFEIGTNGLEVSVNEKAGGELRPRIRIAQASGLVDTSFTTWSGGEPVVIQDGIYGGSLFREPSSGKKTASNLVFHGSSSGSGALCDWINGMAAGEAAALTLNVSEISNGRYLSKKGYDYYQAQACRVSFPRFSTSEDNDVHIVEELEFAVEKVERG
ncbi:MAG: hypothetical protein EOM65_14845, partial [Synergistales bacterium]|nr:hypothetical protein [Synergistales bacterium]